MTMLVEIVLRDGAVYECPSYKTAAGLREEIGRWTQGAWLLGYGPVYHEGQSEAWIRASEVVIIRERRRRG